MANKALKGLTIKIGADTTDLHKSLESVEKQSRSLSGELGEINKLLKLDPNNTDLLAQKQKVLADAINKTKDKLGTLKEAEAQVQKQFERGEVSEAQYRALQREIIATENKLDKYKSAAKETADAQKELAEGAGKSADKLDDAGKSSQSAGESFNKAKVAAAALTAAVLAAGTASVKAFADVDDGADNVIRATGATGQAAEDLTEVYKSVASKVVASFEDIGATVGEVNTRFGYTGSQLDKCSTDFLKFAEITGVNSTEAVKSVTRALNDAGIPLDEYGTLLDHLAKAGQAAGIDVTKLAEGLSVNGATMRSMGLDVAESIALLAQFELSGADATTMLSGMKKAMAAWAKEGKDGSKEFEKLVSGVRSGSVSAADALEVFGTRAGPQLVDAIKSGKFEYEDMLKTLQSSSGTLEKTFSELEDGGYSADRSFQRLKIVASDLGEEILEGAAPALEEFVDYLDKSGVAKKLGDTIKNHVVPAIKAVSSWVNKNGPFIKSTVVGVTAALVAYKVATIAADVAHKGLKSSILATTAAQKALQLVQNATPWGLAATAIAGVSIALATYVRSTKEAKQSVEVLTAEEKALVAAAKEAADAFREQTAAIDAEETSVLSSMGHTEALAKELISLADASGKVQESDEARAQFILGELNEALGTEYSMTNGLIQNYGDLETSIYDLIKAKTAEALLEKNHEAYIAAIEKEAEAWDALIATEKDCQAQEKILAEAKRKVTEAENAHTQAVLDGALNLEYYSAQVAKAEEAEAEAKDALKTKKSRYEAAKNSYVGYQETILQYQTAEEQALQGNYQATQEILAGKGREYRDFTDVVNEETGKVLGALDKEATDAGIKAEWTKKNFEDGIAGFTKAMATEAEQGYSDALSAFDTAYDDAYAVGSDLGTGLVDGMNDWLPTVADTMASAVNAALEAAREAADSHSPARKTIDLGEDMGEGEKIGIENKTKDVKRAAAEQVSAALDAYSLQDVEGQRALRSVTQQQFYNYSVEQTAVANANTPMLEKILTAIERGQVLVLDGDAIVGGTADRMDRALGRRKILASGGVIL